ncbi:hypothetical protein [Clostridium cylindrosporum]|uniref:Bypass of forespore C C-terminal domain-containing protein n=1 Tax=Clostridium cylindrosporum DSM 605 TaxID=1121307 RepID=A0A0J8D5X2_CLOCY|nr:hypothetical protein [Clostridium cylindrosporum]KMT21257.1 hypothetical protein CLCY_2c00170 [Clostridium cylindrosporum DSM 605]
MKVGKIIVLVALIFSIAVSVGTSLYISQNSTDNKNIQGITVEKNDIETSAKTTVLAENKSKAPKINSIGPATKIVKKQIYIKGDTYEKVVNQEITEDLLGMDKTQFDGYAKKIGYSIEEFTSEKVVISEKINEWPKGLYVLKAIDQGIVIFKVDETGNLTKVEETGITLDQVSEQEKAGLVKGKVYATIEEAEHTLADYDS